MNRGETGLTPAQATGQGSSPLLCPAPLPAGLPDLWPSLLPGQSKGQTWSARSFTEVVVQSLA